MAKRFGELLKGTRKAIRSMPGYKGLTKKQARKKYNKSQSSGNRNKLKSGEGNKLSSPLFNNPDFENLPFVGPIQETTPETTPEKPPEKPPEGPDFESIFEAQQKAIDDLLAKLNEPVEAPTVNVDMPDPEESLGRAKAASTYVSGGSAGGIRRRRSNRSKLGFSGLGTNQLNRNVSNLLSIRGISI